MKNYNLITLVEGSVFMAWTRKERSGPCERGTTLLLVSAVEVAQEDTVRPNSCCVFLVVCKSDEKEQRKNIEEYLGKEEQGEPYVSRPICDPIQKDLEGPTKDRPAY